MVSVGDAVVFVDSYAREHEALLTAVHGEGETPSVNLVVVSMDENRRDQYGRQIEHHTSVVHRVNQAAHGMYWFFR